MAKIHNSCILNLSQGNKYPVAKNSEWLKNYMEALNKHNSKESVQIIKQFDGCTELNILNGI